MMDIVTINCCGKETRLSVLRAITPYFPINTPDFYGRLRSFIGGWLGPNNPPGFIQADPIFNVLRVCYLGPLGGIQHAWITT